MISKIIAFSSLALICVMGVHNAICTVVSDPPEIEQQKYKNDFNRIRSFKESIRKGAPIDLEGYEKFADEIEGKWRVKKKEYYANLIWELCGPLTSGIFNDRRQYALARKYAISALEKPDEIPIKTEFDLVQIVASDMIVPGAPTGQVWAQRRKQEVQLKFHAWKRLIGAIDPKWNPNERLVMHPEPPMGVNNYDSGASPESIKDPILRAQYEEAIRKNDQKNERHSLQRKYREWLERLSESVERYSIRAYSKPPDNIEELTQLLKEYISDESLRERILDGVATEKIMKEQAEERFRASGLKKPGEIDKTKYQYIGIAPSPKAKLQEDATRPVRADKTMAPVPSIPAPKRFGPRFAPSRRAYETAPPNAAQLTKLADCVYKIKVAGSKITRKTRE